MERFIILIGIALLISSASAIDSTYTTSAPTIDGVLSGGEWGSGLSITLNGFHSSELTMDGQLYVMNDDTNIYVAIVLADPVQCPYDSMMLDFDQGHDHTATTGGEDAMDYYNGAYADYYWGNDWWSYDTNMGDSTDGTGAQVHSSSQYTYEFSKPLDSGEDTDMSLSPGDTVGFRIETWDSTTLDNYRYPQDTVDSITTRWDEWADLNIGSAATTTTTPTSTTIEGALKGDADGDGTVTDFELLSYIDTWVSGAVTDFDLLEAIDNWTNG